MPVKNVQAALDMLPKKDIADRFTIDKFNSFFLYDKNHSLITRRDTI